MEAEEKKELAELTDELVSKAGPTSGQIKLNQDPDKVARLMELGWTPLEKEPTLEERVKKLEEMLADHEKRITSCSIRR